MRIIEKNSKIEKEINSLILSQSFSIIKKRKNIIRQKIVGIVAQSLSNSLTLSSLSGYGSQNLKYDFGLEFDPSPAIIDAVSNSVRLGINPGGDKRFKKTGTTLITLSIQPRDYNNLLTLAIAEQDIRDGTIPWLEWLLLEGDSVIIYDYSVEYGAGFGRSGGARMKDGGFFKVNPIHSGTRDDNFITRAISRASDDIVSAIQKGLQ